MTTQNNIQAILADNSLIPVVTFNKIEEVDQVISLLVKKRLQCIEITLRTEAALACIKKAKKIAPKNFMVGVGTIVNPQQVIQCKELGVDFMVSPGATTELIGHLKKSGIAFLPGVMTPSEIMNAMKNECLFLKLFPFNVAGGLPALKSYSKVFPSVSFCPTGGVSSSNYKDLLNLPNVVAVGGSWLTA
jgi:2-dehydro-3-deoxyphosphogluconate aldolase/(4S)-4-hydroxy-2-oxoglutarate aldolase